MGRTRLPLTAAHLSLLVCLAALLPLVPLGALPASAGPVAETAAQLPPTDLPEGLAVDSAGATYVGIAPSGAVLRLAPDGSQSVVATLRPGLGSLLGLALDSQGAILAALASQNTPGADRHGIWRVGPDGATALVAPLPSTSMPNALAPVPDGTLFVSDSMAGAIWRIAPGGEAQPWLRHELLEGDLQACPPPALTGPTGANGLVYDPAGALLVANTTKAQIVRVPILPGGDPGTPAVLFGPHCESLAGADGLARDGAGNLYVTLNWQNRLLRLGPQGEMTVLATRADGLDFPASAVVAGDRLLVTNYALLSFLRREGPRPAVLSLPLPAEAR